MIRKTVIKGFALLALVWVLSCSFGGALEGPEAAAKEAFTEWAQQKGVPYKDASFQTLSNDGTFAIVRITAKFRESAEAEWTEQEAKVECRNVGGEWQMSSLTIEFSRPESEILAEQAAATAAFITSWGSRGHDSGQFVYPRSVAVDGDGNVYVADQDNHRIQKFTSDGDFITSWGSIGSGNGQFINPFYVVVNASGHVYVPDPLNRRIQTFTTDGTFVGSWSPTSGDIRIGFVRDMAVDGSGNLYIMQDPRRILKFGPDGSFITSWVAFGYSIAVDSNGDIYVAQDDRISKFTSDGTFITSWGSGGNGHGQFYYPHGVAVDTSDNVYVADTRNHRIQKFTSDGTFIMSWGSQGSGEGQFDEPFDVTVDASGNIYVADLLNHRIQKFHLGH